MQVQILHVYFDISMVKSILFCSHFLLFFSKLTEIKFFLTAGKKKKKKVHT
jgi:hypothetical protein